MRLFAAALALIAAVVSPTAVVGDEADYEIKLVRPPKVGQRYTLKAEGALTREAKYTVGGQQAADVTDGFGIRLEGTVEVLAVNKDGEEHKAACTVSKCVRITAQGEADLVPAGRVVTATGGKEDTTFALDQGELSAEAREALELVFRMGEEDGYHDDRIYGTTKRHAVGSSWPLDAKAATDEAAADGIKFDVKDISGSLKLERVETVDGVECLRIGGDTVINRFTAEPPEDMTFDTGSLKARYWGLYPVDAKLGTLAESMSATRTARFRGKDPGGKEMVVDNKVQRAAEMSRKFLDPK